MDSIDSSVASRKEIEFRIEREKPDAFPDIY